ncbi:MAG: methyltransferase domain-containing protein [Anaerolineae bacterium]|nr:methyltransferase domain-containing protein [Anaerolineae bacterium]
MTEKDIFQNKNYLRDQQYKDSSNLDARANLHRLYSTSPLEWHRWVFAQLDLQPGMTVLECGCGPGWLWRNNLDQIPENCQITLSDFSDGMVAEAAAALADTGHDFRFQTVNIEAIPFADDSFDIVVANHMLYHVPNLAAGLAEVRRVLKENGRFYTATNGADHMRELKELALQFAPESTQFEWPQLTFRLENGRSLLSPPFAHIDLLPYEDSLEVTEVEPLMAYIQSMTLLQVIGRAEETASPERTEGTVAILNQLRAYLTQEIAKNGSFHITKNSGLFTAY